MKTKSGKIVAAISMIGLLASLGVPATAADIFEIRAAAQNATTRSDHEAIAKYYEAADTQMKAKVKEQKALLEQYQNKSYLYGRHAGSRFASSNGFETRRKPRCNRYSKPCAVSEPL